MNARNSSLNLTYLFITILELFVSPLLFLTNNVSLDTITSISVGEITLEPSVKMKVKVYLYFYYKVPFLRWNYKIPLTPIFKVAK